MSSPPALDEQAFTLVDFGVVGGEEGCEVHVVGDHPALGCWAPAQSVICRKVVTVSLVNGGSAFYATADGYGRGWGRVPTPLPVRG